MDMTDGMTLGQLINAGRRGGEVSYERLSKACGGAPSAKRLHQLENSPLKNFPDPDTIRNLSRGTGFSVTEVIFAAARSLGLPVSTDDPDTIRIYGISQAPERVTRLIQDLGREIAELAADQTTSQDQLDLAAHQGDKHVGPYDLPE